jgi:hypothetical protein
MPNSSPATPARIAGHGRKSTDPRRRAGRMGKRSSLHRQLTTARLNTSLGTASATAPALLSPDGPHFPYWSPSVKMTQANRGVSHDLKGGTEEKRMFIFLRAKPEY